MERLLISVSNRGNGLLAKALAEVVKFADKNGIRLSANFLPDEERHYNTLRTSFAANGFSPLEEDGEIYRNDVDRLHKTK